MKRIVLLLTFVVSVLSASAQLTKQIEIGADEIVTLWDNSTAKYSNHMEKDEVVVSKRKFYNTSSADLYIFHPDKQNDTGVSIVIYPGGSYRYVGFSTHFISWCKANGITAAMLKYRVPNGGHNQATLEDATGAVEYMRANAERLGIDPTKVGVAGCSAGGHLAAWSSVVLQGEQKPNFAVLLYPVISGQIWSPKAQWSTFDELLGHLRTPAQMDAHSVDLLVNPQTPPTMFLLSDDDDVVPTVNSTIYYKALKYHGVKSSMHIYPSGGHGWRGRESFEYRQQWLEATKEWILSF